MWVFRFRESTEMTVSEAGKPGASEKFVGSEWSRLRNQTEGSQIRRQLKWH